MIKNKTDLLESKVLKSEKIIGASFGGVFIQTTLRKLRDEFGSESFTNPTNEKTTHEWAFEIRPDSILTIYDWKEFREIELDEEIEWHIGRRNVTKDEIIAFLHDNCLGGDYTLQE